MPFLAAIPAALGISTSTALGAGALGASALGGALGNRSKTTSSNYNQTPTEGAEWGPLGEAARSRALSLLTNPSSLPAGYQTSGISNINQTNAGIMQSIQNRLGASGLSRSPIAGNAMTQAELSRGGQIAEFQNQLPLLERALKNQDYELALQTYNARPVGQTSTGTTQYPGNMTGGAFGGFGSMLGYLLGSGALGNGKETVTV